MTTDSALVKLGQSTVEAVAGVLEMFVPGQVEVGDVSVVAADRHPLEGVPVPAVATMVSYVDGVTGGNLFVMSVNGARRLAAATMGTEPNESAGADELSELELSAIAEAMSQMMASAAGATSAVLDTDVEIGEPDTCTFTSTEEALAAYARTPHATSCAVTVCDEPCRLVQLVPNAFAVRMTRAFDEIGATPTADGGQRATGTSGGAGTPSLAGIPVRVWAELGRAEMPSAHVVGLRTGAVVELNRQVEEPIDLYVNGRRFATGRLVVADGADWAVRIEHVLGPDDI
jgi:flagellar motor switch protein FliN